MTHVKRWTIILVGGLIAIIGLVLMPLPGPGGTPVTLAGLAILSSEVPWARRLLERLKQRMAQGYSGPQGSRQRWRRLSLAAGLLAFWVVGGIAAWRIWPF
jgi:uncharacterized protein (TIGR02611 family)